jgi:hypothetical protein
MTKVTTLSGITPAKGKRKGHAEQPRVGEAATQVNNRLVTRRPY